jgi:hypothetical protein
VTTFARLYKEVRSCWPEWTSLFLYAALVAFAIPYHEPWADEAQAWQLARSLSLPALFQTYLRYEASPGLWHLLLWILIRAHVSYVGLHWICGGIAVGATALLVLKSPFPRYLKLVLPFTYFLLFQYAVVARSYVLVPILLYLIALCWKKNPLILALLLGLLANVALHAAVFSGGLALVYFIEQVRDGILKGYRRQLLPGALTLLILWAVALWTAWPPPDNSFYASYTPGASRPFLAWILMSPLWEICQPWILSIAFWIAIAFCLSRRGNLLYLLPVLFFAAFSGAVLFAWWHIGLLVPLVICLLWITWPTPEGKICRPEAIACIAMVVMSAIQIFWSAYAVQFDHYNAYSPDLATANFLQPFVRQGARIAVTYSDDPDGHGYRSIGILPYFDHNIFINQPDSFWPWNHPNPTEGMFMKVLPTHPALILVDVRSHHPELPVNLQDPRIRLLDRTGYRFTNMFCGAMPMRFQPAEKSCHLIFQRVDDEQEPVEQRASQASAVR